MRILIITQKVDINDPILGFFHSWINKFAPHFEKVSVICLEKGEINLPNNVKVYSLGKEAGKSKLKYVSRFFRYILGLAREYDTVFVHMNQEYMLMGGWFWRLTRKKIIFWRNHPKGNLLTRVASHLANTVLCTSKFAFVARYKKTQLMPVGIDTHIFGSQNSNKRERDRGRILSIGRVSPIKNIDLMIETIRILHDRKVSCKFDIVGSPVNPEDSDYRDKLVRDAQDLVESGVINFLPAVPHHETPELYAQHEVFLNLTPTGSLDKTIFEAAVSGTIPVVTNLSLQGEIDPRLIVREASPQLIANCVELILDLKEDEKDALRKKLASNVLEHQSNNALTTKLVKILQNG